MKVMNCLFSFQALEYSFTGTLCSLSLVVGGGHSPCCSFMFDFDLGSNPCVGHECQRS